MIAEFYCGTEVKCCWCRIWTHWAKLSQKTQKSAITEVNTPESWSINIMTALPFICLQHQYDSMLIPLEEISTYPQRSIAFYCLRSLLSWVVLYKRTSTVHFHTNNFDPRTGFFIHSMSLSRHKMFDRLVRWKHWQSRRPTCCMICTHRQRLLRWAGKVTSTRTRSRCDGAPFSQLQQKPFPSLNTDTESAEPRRMLWTRVILEICREISRLWKGEIGECMEWMLQSCITLSS